MADDAAPKTPDEELREKVNRYGAAFAVMAEGFKGEGIDRLVKAVQVFILAAAAFVVAAAVYASFTA